MSEHHETNEGHPYTAHVHGHCEVCNVVIQPGDEVVRLQGVEIHASCRETDIPTPVSNSRMRVMGHHVATTDLIGGPDHQAEVRALYSDG